MCTPMYLFAFMCGRRSVLGIVDRSPKPPVSVHANQKPTVGLYGPIAAPLCYEFIERMAFERMERARVQNQA